MTRVKQPTQVHHTKQKELDAHLEMLIHLYTVEQFNANDTEKCIHHLNYILYYQ